MHFLNIYIAFSSELCRKYKKSNLVFIKIINVLKKKSNFLLHLKFLKN